MKVFDVLNIELESNNLIEASAGTGKTYSIGILALRLLLEKDIKIEEILMVTFTNAAVAELEIRIRKFLKDALKSISSDDKIDSTIKDVVERAKKNKRINEIEKLLSDAVLFLDESAIYTIHGFCQLTLSEFAFDTKQLFNTELIENQTILIENSVNDFWRKKITILDPLIIAVLKEKLFSRELLIDFAKNIFSGKKLSVRNGIDRTMILSEITRFNEEIKVTDEKLSVSIDENWSTITNTKIPKNTNLYKSISKGQSQFKTELIKAYSANPMAKSLTNLGFLIDVLKELVLLNTSFDTYKSDVFIDFLASAEIFIREDVEKKKNRNQVLSFNDLIEKLHTSLVKEDNKRLKQDLCNKYKAVFIDEFQDTDHLQYEIFHKAFIENCNSTVFFIGDPKQSIYAWRGADLQTYVRAQKNLGDRKYTMKNNFRSTAQLISAMNDFFPAGISCSEEYSQDSDPFCSRDIDYEIVEPGNKNLAELYDKNNPATAFDIIYHDKVISKKQYLFESAGVEIADLLANHYLLKDGNKLKIKPENICVLLRSKAETKLMKSVLTKYGIPAIIVDDTKIMETNEARDLFYVLYAVLNNDTGSLSRALLNSFTGFGIDDIEVLDFDYYRLTFLDLQDIWAKDGVYSTILNFIAKFDIRKNLLDSDNPQGNRIYTNLMQLAEILNEKEFNNNYSPENLLDWFQKSRERLESLNEYEQRIESDKDAVEIMTIHKSKGLSFDIVVLPYINLKVKSINQNEPISYLTENGFYISYHKTEEELEQYKFQSEQENRRLLYVAITRAVYKCIIHYDDQKGTLQSFIPNINQNCTSISHRSPKQDFDFRYSEDIGKQINKEPLIFSKSLDDTWKLTSYSALDTHNSTYSREKNLNNEEQNEYDKFIFSILKKGAQTGLILHNIFEKIDFADNTFWEREIDKNLKVYGRENTDTKMKNYLRLVQNTVKAKLFPNNFSLANIPFDNRFNELEFYFSFENWDSYEIKKLFPKISINDKDISGIMHGFIDLLFEYKGKFYILDWKSNHLGYTLDNYTTDKLEEAMTENNYHLQYIVYTIAVKRFLENRIKDFDYNKHFGGVYYLFLRGLREYKNTGVYYNKSEKELIDKIENMLLS